MSHKIKATTLDTIEAFSYIWQYWRYFGMYPDLYARRVNWGYLIVLNLLCGVIFPLKRMVKICRWIFWGTFVGFWFAILFYGVADIFRHKLPFESGILFDWQRSVLAYVCACALQMFGMGIQTSNATCCDTYAVTYLVLLVTHLRILNERIARVGCAGASNDAENYRELVACVEYHKECMSYFISIRPMLSGTCFIQFLSTAWGLSTSAIAFVRGNIGFSDSIKFLILFGSIIIEVVPCCWFMDEVLAEMRKLTNSMYSCRWYKQNLRFRKALIIFMQRSQKIHPIVAGNLMTVSLETFTMIIKFAFSLFTLLSQLNS